MILHGINFPNVMNAAGACAFFDPRKEYPYRWWYETFLGLSTGCLGFVAKTMTFNAKAGNAHVKADGITFDGFNRHCIKPSIPIIGDGITLNAVGLTNPGCEALLEKRIWQQRTDNFFLSFMAVSKTADERAVELGQFIGMLLSHQAKQWRGDIGLEINVSCPNTGHDTGELYNEVSNMLNFAGALGIPIQVKFNALTDPKKVAEIAQHSACNAIVMGNTMPFGTHPHESIRACIDWQKLYGGISPLASLGGGGLSGPPLLPIHCEWIRNFRGYDSETPVWGCGGIFCMEDIDHYKQAGATGVQLGTVIIHRPWRVQDMIQYSRALIW